MKHVLTPISISELPVGWEKNFPFSALSVKPFKAAAARALLPKGIDLHLWEWASFTSIETARAWGKKMAEHCAAYGATRFYIDFEAEATGEGKFPIVKEPYKNLLEAVTAFHLHASADVELVYNGFTWSRTEDGRKLHDADLMKLFDAFCPMIYQETRAELDNKQFGFVAKLDKYKNVPGLKRIPMVYAGRYVDGKYIGQKASDLIDKVIETKPDEVAWYFGNDSKSRYFELVNEIKQMNAALEGGTPSQVENTYTVVRGDSWWGIADRAYGDGPLWKKLREANGGKTALHPGDVIVLPKKEILVNASA